MIFLLFLSFAFACRVTNRDDYLGCFSQYLDFDHNNIITVSEIDTAILQHYNFSNISFNGTIIMSKCDMNGDGVLTQAGDWNNQTSCLKKTFSLTAMYVCDICVRYGWTFPTRKK